MASIIISSCFSSPTVFSRAKSSDNLCKFNAHTKILPPFSSCFVMGTQKISMKSSQRCNIFKSSVRNGVMCSAAEAASSVLPSALLFDCDGVLVDTEKDGHRISFNDTFAEVIIFLIPMYMFVCSFGFVGQ